VIFPAELQYQIAKMLGIIAVVAGCLWAFATVVRAPLKAELAILKASIEQQKKNAAALLKAETEKTKLAESRERDKAAQLEREAKAYEKITNDLAVRNNDLAKRLLDLARRGDGSTSPVPAAPTAATINPEACSCELSGALERIVATGNRLAREADEVRDQLLTCQEWIKQ
jgi:rRNA-processing protein FCF1